MLMDRIMSIRIDESVAKRIEMLAKQLNTTRKAVIENAVGYYAGKIEADQNIDILSQTLGSWQRDESDGKTVEQIRGKMHRSQGRYNRQT
jgi:predicted transcriptional regulator